MIMRIYHIIYGAIATIRIWTVLILCMLGAAEGRAQFAPVVGYPGTTAIAAASASFTGWATGCTIYRGYRDIAVPDSGYASVGDSSAAIGMATTNGVVSLGDSGIAILTFDEPIADGTGFDFAVFENGFDAGGPGMAFLELAFVEVSSDGLRYVRFPTIDNVQDSMQIALGSIDGSLLNNLAGKYVYGYGTPYDLSELIDSPGLDVQHVTHVKIIDVIGSINPAHASRDSRGKIINDPYPTNYASSGFDLDAVGVIGHNTTGIAESSNDAIQVYPNPAAHYLNIHLTDGVNNKLTITDMNGRELMNVNIQDEARIDISSYTSGLYCVRVQNDKGSISKTIMKQ